MHRQNELDQFLPLLSCPLELFSPGILLSNDDSVFPELIPPVHMLSRLLDLVSRMPIAIHLRVCLGNNALLDLHHVVHFIDLIVSRQHSPVLLDAIYPVLVLAQMLWNVLLLQTELFHDLVRVGVLARLFAPRRRVKRLRCQLRDYIVPAVSVRTLRQCRLRQTMEWGGHGASRASWATDHHSQLVLVQSLDLRRSRNYFKAFLLLVR